MRFRFRHQATSLQLCCQWPEMPFLCTRFEKLSIRNKFVLFSLGNETKSQSLLCEDGSFSCRLVFQFQYIKNRPEVSHQGFWKYRQIFNLLWKRQILPAIYSIFQDKESSSILPRPRAVQVLSTQALTNLPKSSLLRSILVIRGHMCTLKYPFLWPAVLLHCVGKLRSNFKLYLYSGDGKIQVLGMSSIQYVNEHCQVLLCTVSFVIAWFFF